MNLVRIGEFAWTAMEPAEGTFTLDWLHTVVGKLQKEKINVLLCTPTAAPPIWLTRTYPETLAVRRGGQRVAHGSRRHYCPTNATFRRHSARVTEKLATEFAPYDNVIAWQLDNELGPECTFCFCNDCSAAFRRWCRDRYVTLDALNAAWQTRFWSMDFTEWDQVGLGIMPHANYGGDGFSGRNGYPSIEFDIRRFFSDTFVDFAAHQTQILRRLHPGSMVGTNMMGPLFQSIDYYKMAELFDYVADDLYFDLGTMSVDVLAMDVFRGMAPPKPFWITETGSAGLTHQKGPYPKQLRAWAFSALAHGCKAHIFFRWRTCLAGHEQDLQGILEHSGLPSYRYRAVKDLFTELAALEKPLASLPLPAPEVAFINSFESVIAYDTTVIGRSVRYMPHHCETHQHFFDRNVQVDYIPPGRDLSPYKLVVLPTICLVTDDLARRLRAFVNAGGVVLATPQLATRDANNNYVPRVAPDGLQDVFGLHVDSHNYLENACEADQTLATPVQTMVAETPAVQCLQGPSGLCERYMEDLVLTTASPLAVYRDNLYASRPAAAVNPFGHGEAFYLGAFLDKTLTGHIIDLALTRAGVKQGPRTDPWVEVLTVGDFTVAINHSRTTTRVTMPTGKPLVGEVKDGVTTLEAYDVCVVKRKYKENPS